MADFRKQILAIPYVKNKSWGLALVVNVWVPNDWNDITKKKAFGVCTKCLKISSLAFMYSHKVSKNVLKVK